MKFMIMLSSVLLGIFIGTLIGIALATERYEGRIHKYRIRYKRMQDGYMRRVENLEGANEYLRSAYERRKLNDSI